VAKIYLALEKSNERFNLFKTFWNVRGIDGIRADSMTEGIEKAIELEKSAVVELLFISIVADDIDFLPQLSILSNETTSPILIATSNPSTSEREDALNNGADYYGEYCDTPEENVNTVIAVLNSIERRSKKKKGPGKVIAHGDFLLISGDNKAFIKDTEITLTSAESEVLYYFALHRGNVLSHMQIYKQISRDLYEPTPEMIYSIMARLRKKIRSVTEVEYIETVRGVGYRFKAKDST